MVVVGYRTTKVRERNNSRTNFIFSASQTRLHRPEYDVPSCVVVLPSFPPASNNTWIERYSSSSSLFLPNPAEIPPRLVVHGVLVADPSHNNGFSDPDAFLSLPERP